MFPFIFMVPAAAVVGVVALFMHLHKRNRAGWNTEEPVVADRAGAYRSSQKTVGIVERIRDVPTEVQVAAIIALFFGIMWIPSIPIVGVGVMVEADEGPGLAMLFGIPGLFLSFAHLILGLRFTKRTESARGIARGVAIWSIVHNVALLAFTVMVNVAGHVSKSIDIVHFDKVGLVVFVYASASLGYAGYAFYAAKVHEALDRLGRVEEQPSRIEPNVILPGTEDGASAPLAAPVAGPVNAALGAADGPSWP